MSKRSNKKRQIATSKARPQAIHPKPLPHTTTELHIAKHESYSGSLPHPDHLERFERIHPGISGQLVAMIIKEQADANETVKRQLDIHEKIVECTAADNKRMHYVALAALALCLSASVSLAALHAFKASAIVGGATVVGVVGAFLHRQVKGKKE